MVAIRHTHLLKSCDFDIHQWCKVLKLSPECEVQLTRAWQFMSALIKSQTDLPQEPCSYLLLGLEITEILSSLNMDNDSLTAAILYPIKMLNLCSDEEISEQFNPTIIKLLQSVQHMDDIRKLHTTSTIDTLKVDNIRRMLLAMAEDFRSVIIKLAERIIFLRDDNHLHSEEERVLAAKECQNIYAPLANRLGIGQLKWELEDYCFRVLHTDTYHKIAKLLKERRLDREKYIADFVEDLNKYLREYLPSVEVYGRPKHIYSIWKKMQKKQIEFSELYDVRAVRIIVPQLQDCYTALGVVHTHFKHLPQEFDDYVANPKPNGYQSIHTVVLGKGGKHIEVQIRTQQMHDDAELGVAAHWKYKEGITGSNANYEEKIAWLRQLLAWQEDLSDSNELLTEIKSQIFDDRVYVFSPKGSVIDLPNGSTPLDFAYAIHSDIGHRCIGAKVAGRIVSFTYQLQMGDQVEILTQKNPNPSRDWINPNLGYTHTQKARNRINSFFKKIDREKNIPQGKLLLENELIPLNIPLKQAEKLLLPRYNLKQSDDLFAAIGSGDIRISQVMSFLNSKQPKASAEEIDNEIIRQMETRVSSPKVPTKENINDKIVVEGVGNLMHYMAGCCQPIYGDEIIGYITISRGISIHRYDCEQLHEMQLNHPERIVDARWGEKNTQSYRLQLHIVANIRHGLLRDITTVLANYKILVFNVNTRLDQKKNIIYSQIEIKLNDVELLNKVLSSLEKIPDIIEAKRL